MADIAHPTPASTGQPLPHASPPVRADRRLVPVPEQRIALAALALLGAIEGVSRVNDEMATLVLRLLAPTANGLTAELRAAGYEIGRKPRA